MVAPETEPARTKGGDVGRSWTDRPDLQARGISAGKPLTADLNRLSVRDEPQAAVEAFRRPGLAARMRPFLAAVLVAFASLPVAGIQRPALALAAAMTLSIAGGAVWLLRRESAPDGVALVPAVSLVATSLLLGEAAGDSGAAYESLLAVPLLWVALYGSRSHVLIVLATAALAYSVTALSAASPTAAWLKAGVVPAIAGLVSLRVQAMTAENRWLLLFDPLTGLANRRRLELDLPREVARAERSGRQLAVAMIDLDHFNRHIATLGHPAADRLLQRAATAWSSTLRSADLLARYGGDEFVLVLPDTRACEAEAALERLRQATPEPLTCSTGVASFVEGEAPERLLARADRALYAAKAMGRDRTHRIRA